MTGDVVSNRWRQRAAARALAHTALLVLALAGCSKSHDVDTTPIVGFPKTANGGDIVGGGVVVGAPGTSGTGGSRAGGTGGVGTGGTPGTVPGGPVSHDVSACMPCQAAMGLTGTIEACCTVDKKCGLDLSSMNPQAGCVQQNAPGTQTMSCPTASYMGFVTIPGCCGADGRCGLVIQQLAPLGCVKESVVGPLIGTSMGMGGMNGGGTRGGGTRGGGTAVNAMRCTEVPAQVTGVQ
jgi:hypothetical protein